MEKKKLLRPAVGSCESHTSPIRASGPWTDKESSPGEAYLSTRVTWLMGLCGSCLMGLVRLPGLPRIREAWGFWKGPSWVR